MKWQFAYINYREKTTGSIYRNMRLTKKKILLIENTYKQAYI
jgi:hypothetical protein